MRIGISPRVGCGTRDLSSRDSADRGAEERGRELLEVLELKLRVISVRPRGVDLARSLSFSSADTRSNCLYL